MTCKNHLMDAVRKGIEADGGARAADSPAEPCPRVPQERGRLMDPGGSPLSSTAGDLAAPSRWLGPHWGLGWGVRPKETVEVVRAPGCRQGWGRSALLPIALDIHGLLCCVWGSERRKIRGRKEGLSHRPCEKRSKKQSNNKYIQSGKRQLEIRRNRKEYQLEALSMKNVIGGIIEEIDWKATL